MPAIPGCLSPGRLWARLYPRVMREGRNMAEIVAAFGVPHTPNFPALVAKQGPGLRDGAGSMPRSHSASARRSARRARHLYRRSFQHLLPRQFPDLRDRRRRPDVRPQRPDRDAALSRRGRGALASHLRAKTISAGFDVSLVQEFELDHSIMVPLHFLTPDMTDSDRSDVHQWPRTAAAERATLLCAWAGR